MSDLYHVFPRVVPADQVSVISIRGLYPHVDFRQLRGVLSADYVCADGLLLDGLLPGVTMGNGYDLGRPNFSELQGDFDQASGTLRLRLNFRGEGEHSIRILCDQRPVAIFRIYSLPESIYSLRPFRGDMHIHSGFSGCNKDRATPEYFAAASCEAGLDFISIADHKQMAPSKQAVAFAEKCGGRLQAYTGEEAHLHDLHNLHFLNFGGRESISDFLKNNPEQFARELALFYEGLPADIDERLRQLMASCDYLLHKINEFGGLSVLCHPFWRPHERYFLPTPVLEHLGRRLNFDALEIIGSGSVTFTHRETNQLAVRFWQELCMREGKYIPVVGNTDAHSCESLGLNCTIVFAPANTRENLIDAVKANRSVAIEQIPGEFPGFYGSFNLVAFAYFLRREYFPRHDEICRQQAKLMFAALRNETVDAEAMHALNCELQQYDNLFWKD